MMMNSKARGSISNFVQLAGMRGTMQKPNGEPVEIPIVSSFRDGLSVSEFFLSTHGARKGSADTALKTADSGYMTRRLVDVAHDIIVREEDCHTTQGVKVSAFKDDKDGIIEPFYERIVGRFTNKKVINPETKEVIVDKNGETVTYKTGAKEIVGYTDGENPMPIYEDEEEDVCDISNFANLYDWIMSTAVSEDDDIETRTKKLNEFNNNVYNKFDKDYLLFYYVYTFVAQMVDQRAKNMFLTHWAEKDGKYGKWQPWLYDNDTCLGINNEG
jgi:hypothetical protein